MRQLDLFADLFSNPPADQQQDEIAVAEKEQKDELNLQCQEEPAPQTLVVEVEDPETLVNEEIEIAVATENTADEEIQAPVIYSDGKIQVKIKVKPAPIVNLTPEVEKPVVLQKRGRKSLKEMDAEADLVEIPGDEVLFQKQYYPISEVANWFRVNTSLIRYWSNEFTILKPRKNRKGDRMYRPEDVKNLQLIYQLLRVRKFSIEGAKDYIKANKKKADTQLQLTQTLQKFKGFLLELKANLQS